METSGQWLQQYGVISAVSLMLSDGVLSFVLALAGPSVCSQIFHVSQTDKQAENDSEGG